MDLFAFTWPPWVTPEIKLGIIAGSATLGVLLFLLMVISSLRHICRPNEVLIFSGRSRTLADGTKVGFRVVFDGGATRWPIVERIDRMDMRLMPIELHVTNAYSRGGIALSVHAIANVKVSSDRDHIHNAIERFLGTPQEQIRRVAKETLEGILRQVLATLTPEEINENRLKFADALLADAEEDLQKLGLHLDTLKIQHVADESNYLSSIGRVRIAQILRDASIAESNAQNEANKEVAAATARGEIARANGKRAIVQSENELRRLRAELEAQAKSEEERSLAAALTARAQAEQELQGVRAQVEQARLLAEVEIPAEAQRVAAASLARGQAAPIAENGAAVGQVLDLMAETWSKAGPQARDIFLIQQIEQLVAAVVDSVRTAVRVRDVSLIDGGDGKALANYVASYPETVRAVLASLKDSIGIDIPAILSTAGQKQLGQSTGVSR